MLEENTIQGVEDPSIEFSSDLLKNHLIRVVSPTTVEPNVEPTDEGEVSVETSIETEITLPGEKSLRPDFTTIGFGTYCRSYECRRIR